ncbi:hypothetical protein Tco_0707198 [Tanacetum coccineum]|uniref:Transmembrane protein n=1 Tax=Tanacetum coccineum TaxID=301880 RepID=A0ABQ4YAG2_9ASTR
MCWFDDVAGEVFGVVWCELDEGAVIGELCLGVFGSVFCVGEMLVLVEVDDEVVFGSVFYDGNTCSIGEGNRNVGRFVGSIVVGSDAVEGFGGMLANGNSVSSNKTCLLMMVLCVSGCSLGLETCIPAWIFIVFTCTGTIVVCMNWINFPPIHAACLEKLSS